MSGKLKITLEKDDDGTGQLFISFQTSDFSGKSSAWFDLNRLEKNLELFLEYPLPSEHPPFIRGGYWSKETPQLEQEHLYLSVVPKGSVGRLAVKIRLTTPHDNTDYLEQQFHTSGELQTNYAQLADFIKNFKHLIHGTLDEVILYEMKE